MVITVMMCLALLGGVAFASDEAIGKENQGKDKKMLIEIDVRTGKQIVSDEDGKPAENMALSNLILEENMDGKIIRHKVFAISEGAIIRTNPCTWVVVNGVLKRICW